MRKVAIILGIVSMSLIVSCLAAKQAGRTANDAARILCELFAADNQSAVGMSPEQWCDLRDNLDPFIENVLAAQRTAGAAALNPNGSSPTPSSEAQGTGP